MTQEPEREVYSGPRDIVSLLSEASRRVGFIPKAQANSDGGPGFKFRGIDQVMGATHEVFNDLGIVIVPTVLKDKRRYSVRTNRNGQEIEWERVRLTVQFAFTAVSNNGMPTVLNVTMVGSGLDNSDKASNKALSQALKYCLLQVLNIPASDMAESDRHSPQVEGARRPQGAQQRPQELSANWGSIWNYFASVGFKGKLMSSLRELEWGDNVRLDADLDRAYALAKAAWVFDWSTIQTPDEAFDQVLVFMETLEEPHIEEEAERG